MRRFFFLLLVVLLLLPGLPFLLKPGVEYALRRLGIEGQVGRVEGYALLGLTFTDVRLRLPQGSLRARRLRVSYNLLGLVSRKLPLAIELEGAELRTRWKALIPQPGAAALPPAAVEPVLLGMRLDNVAIEVDEDTDWALPHLIARIEGRGPYRVRFALPEGEGEGRLDLQARVFDFESDLRALRYWYPEIERGRLRGRLAFKAAPRLVAQVEGGAGTVVGFSLHDIAGEVRWAGNRVEARLAGRGLGGPVESRGIVDLAKPGYDFEVRARPQLARLAEHFGVHLPLRGQGQLSLRVRGWEAPLVEGHFQGAPELWGQRLALAGTLGFDHRFWLKARVFGRFFDRQAELRATIEDRRYRLDYQDDRGSQLRVSGEDSRARGSGRYVWPEPFAGSAVLSLGLEGARWWIESHSPEVRLPLFRPFSLSGRIGGEGEAVEGRLGPLHLSGRWSALSWRLDPLRLIVGRLQGAGRFEGRISGRLDYASPFLDLRAELTQDENGVRLRGEHFLARFGREGVDLEARRLPLRLLGPLTLDAQAHYARGSWSGRWTLGGWLSAEGRFVGKGTRFDGQALGLSFSGSLDPQGLRLFADEAELRVAQGGVMYRGRLRHQGVELDGTLVYRQGRFVGDLRLTGPLGLRAHVFGRGGALWLSGRAPLDLQGRLWPQPKLSGVLGPLMVGPVRLAALPVEVKGSRVRLGEGWLDLGRGRFLLRWPLWIAGRSAVFELAGGPAGGRARLSGPELDLVAEGPWSGLRLSGWLGLLGQYADVKGQIDLGSLGYQGELRPRGVKGGVSFVGQGSRLRLEGRLISGGVLVLKGDGRGVSLAAEGFDLTPFGLMGRLDGWLDTRGPSADLSLRGPFGEFTLQGRGRLGLRLHGPYVEGAGWVEGTSGVLRISSRLPWINGGVTLRYEGGRLSADGAGSWQLPGLNAPWTLRLQGAHWQITGPIAIEGEGAAYQGEVRLLQGAFSLLGKFFGQGPRYHGRFRLGLPKGEGQLFLEGDPWPRAKLLLPGGEVRFSHAGLAVPGLDLGPLLEALGFSGGGRIAGSLAPGGRLSGWALVAGQRLSFALRDSGGLLWFPDAQAGLFLNIPALEARGIGRLRGRLTGWPPRGDLTYVGSLRARLQLGDGLTLFAKGAGLVLSLKETSGAWAGAAEYHGACGKGRLRFFGTWPNLQGSGRLAWRCGLVQEGPLFLQGTRLEWAAPLAVFAGYDRGPYLRFEGGAPLEGGGRLVANLGWRPSGFAGHLRVKGAGLELDATAADGPLRWGLVGPGVRGKGSLGSDLTLQGQAGLSRALGPWGLEAKARVDGSLLAPRLRGHGVLRGLRARLPFSFGYGPGPWLRAEAEGMRIALDGSFLSAQLDLDLTPWVGVGLRLVGEAADDLSDFRLPLRLTGPELDLKGALVAQPLGLELKGNLRGGQLALVASPERADLSLDLPSPRLKGRLSWREGAPPRGQLTFDLLGVQGQAELWGTTLLLRSEGALVVDLAGPRARGAVGLGPLRLMGEGGEVILAGEGPLRGFSGRLDLVARRFDWSFVGPLPGGLARAELSGRLPGRWLKGALYVGGERIELQGEGASVRLRGPHLEGRLEARGLALALRDFYGLSGEISGPWDGFTGRIEGYGSEVRLTRGEEGLRLDFSGKVQGRARLGRDGLAGRLTLPGGVLELGPGWRASGAWLGRPLSLTPEALAWDRLVFDPRARRFHGVAELGGLRLLGEGPRLSARWDGFRLLLDIRRLELRLTHDQGSGALTWRSGRFSGTLGLGWLTFRGEGERVTIRGQHPALVGTPLGPGRLEAELDAQLRWRLGYRAGELALTGEGRGLDGSLDVRSPWGQGRLRLTGEGPKGRLELARVPLFGRRLFLAVRDRVLSARLRGAAGVIEGRLLLDGYRPIEAEAYAPTLRVEKIPELRAKLPGLRGQLAGVALWKDGHLTVQLGSAALGAPGRSAPFALTWRDRRGHLQWDGLDLEVEAGDAYDALRGRFMGFDLSALAAWRVPEVPGEVRLSGAFAAQLPADRPLDGRLQLALERIRVAGKRQRLLGRLALVYAERTLSIKTLTLSGDGSLRGGGHWRMGEGGDLWLRLKGTDVSPLLALIPGWSKLDPRFKGDLSLAAEGRRLKGSAQGAWGLGVLRGDLEAEARYDVQTGAVLVGRLRTSQPFVMDVGLKGRGDLEAFRLEGVGDLAFPGVDPIEGFRFSLDWPAGSLSFAWKGFKGRGRLRPLEVEGEGPLALGAPGYYLAEASGDARLSLRQDAAGRYHLGGELRVGQALLTLPEKPLPLKKGEGALPLDFDRLHIVAERGVLLRAPLVEGELGGNLYLGGSAAQPFLSGEARALRGSFLLFNRRFLVIEGWARFSPEHGLLPELFLRARSDTPAGPVYLVAVGRVVERGGQLALELDPCLSLEPTSSLLTCKATPQEEAAARLLGLGEESAEGVAGAAIENLLSDQLENALARALGLDVVRVETHVLAGEGLEKTRFTLGKYLRPDLYLAYDWSAETGGRLYARVRREGVTLEFRTDVSPDPSPEFSLHYAFTPDLSGVLELARDRFRLGLEWRP